MKSHILRTFTKMTLMATFVCLATTSAWAKPKRVLVVSVTAGYRHSSIETAQRTLKALAEKDGGFTVVDVVDTGARPKEKTPEEAAWLERTRGQPPSPPPTPPAAPRGSFLPAQR